jgi:bacterioferritin
MQGRPEIIELLNEVLTAELTAVNQYFGHAKMQANWGYHRLADHSKDESIDEMKHADRIIERVLYFEGVPNMQRYAKVNVGENVPEQLKLDLELEQHAIPVLNRAIAQCRNLGDNGTAELLEDILVEEEEHANWLEAQLGLIAQLGAQNYLAEQIKKDD